MGLPTKFTPRVQETFLKLYRGNGVINRSSHDLNISPETPRQHAMKHPEFAAAMAQALQDYRDTLEIEAYRRAVEGVEKPVYYKGVVVGQVLEYSDRMLELKLKRHIPEYRDRHTLDVTHAGGVLVVHKAHATSEDWEKEEK